MVCGDISCDSCIDCLMVLYSPPFFPIFFQLLLCPPPPPPPKHTTHVPAPTSDCWANDECASGTCMGNGEIDSINTGAVCSPTNNGQGKCAHEDFTLVAEHACSKNLECVSNQVSRVVMVCGDISCDSCIDCLMVLYSPPFFPFFFQFFFQLLLCPVHRQRWRTTGSIFSRKSRRAMWI